ncbi:MAG: M15 family metallopeptidase [Bacteriovoracaceae bacterium]
MNYLELTGRENNDLIPWDQKNKVYIHKSMQESLRELQNAAAKENINIQVASGFRDYNRQLDIWNAKASGSRKLLDRQENIIDFDRSTSHEILDAMLAWSAIPGASRHHWGSEIDIFDQNVKPKEKVHLTQIECREDFHLMYSWLDQNLEMIPFHRPYAEDLGGVAQEAWHLSFTPVSKSFQKEYTLEVFEKNVRESSMLFKELVLKDLESIYLKYVANVKNP